MQESEALEYSGGLPKSGLMAQNSLDVKLVVKEEDDDCSDVDCFVCMPEVVR
jgi:hypothetical protein